MKSLQGSKKQISWATDIRTRIENEIEGIEKKIKSDNSDTDSRFAKVVEIIKGIKQETSAAWWIENRDNSAGYIIQTIFKSN